MTLATIVQVNPADKVMVNKMTAMVPVNKMIAMVPVNKMTATVLVNNHTVPDRSRMVPVNNHMVPDKNRMGPDNNHMVLDNKRATIMAPVNKVLTTAPANKATDLVNKAVMIIALVNKDLMTMVQDLVVLNPINQKLQATVPAMITLKVAEAALNTEEQALPMILTDPETPTTRVTDLVNKVAAAMDLAKLTIMDLAKLTIMDLAKLTIMDLAIRAVMLGMDNSNMDNSNMESNNVDNRVMEIRVEGMMTIIDQYSRSLLNLGGSSYY